MEYRYLGSSGLQVSALSIGTWITYGGQVGEDTATECLQAAHAAGVNFIDGAEAYDGGNAERVLGNVVKRLGWKRTDLVISTKIFWGGTGPNDRGLSRKHIVEGVDAALARLQTHYVDLVFCHRPDIHTPIEETVRAMNTVIERGKAFYWGTSEWSAAQIMEAVGIARREHLIPPQMEQPQYNMLNRERVELEYRALYDEIGLGTTVFSPLASGILTGKYNDGIPDGTRLALDGYGWLRERVMGEGADEMLSKVQALRPVADDLGVSLAQLAIAWCLKNTHVSTVITGASSVDQVLENMKALSVAESLTDVHMNRIETILGNRPVPPTDFRL